MKKRLLFSVETLATLTFVAYEFWQGILSALYVHIPVTSLTSSSEGVYLSAGVCAK